MNFFDMRTIVFSYMVTSMLCALFVVLLWWRYRRRFAGTGFWALDFILQTAALLLIVMRGTLPDWMSMVLSNAMVVLGAIFGFMGLERFLGRKGSQIHNVVLLALFILCHGYFALVQPSLAARNLNIAVALLLVCGQSVWLVYRGVEPALRSLALGVGAVRLLYCVLSAIRIALFFVAPQAENDYFRPVVVEALVLVAYQALFISLTYSIGLMVSNRLLSEIHAQEEKFSKAFHSAPYAIALSRLSDGLIIDVNRTFTDLTGYERAEVLKKKSTDLNIWQCDEDRAAAMKALSKTGVVRGLEMRFRRKNGEIVEGLFSAELIIVDGEANILSCIGDITDRKRAEFALRESEARLRDITFSMADWVWEVDANAVYTYSSQKGYDLLGRSPESIVGKRPFDFMPPDEAKRVAAAFAEIAANKAPVKDLENWNVRADGAVVCLLTNAVPVLDAAGRLTGYRGVDKDITERKRVEAALLASEARYRTLVDWSPESIVVHRDGRVIFANPAARAMFGATPGQDLVGMPTLDLVHPDFQENWSARQRNLVERGINAPMKHRRMVRLDGTVFDAEVQGTSIDFEGAPAIHLAIRDITERKQAEEDLRRFRMAMDVTADGIYIVDRASLRFIDVNVGACNMLGLTREQILEAGPAGVLSTSREELAGTYDAVIAGGGVAAPVEMLRTRRDGTQAWIEVRRQAQPLGEGWMIVTVARDITKRKNAEAARGLLESQLRESQKMEALGTLAGGVAHDFNNALAAIMGNVELARQDVGEGHAALVSLEEIGKASRRAKDLVHQILSFGRRQPLQLRVMSLALVVVETARLIRATLPAEVSLNVECAHDAPAILADATQINQILLNLCGNALHAVQGRERPGVIDISLCAHSESGAPYDAPNRRSGDGRVALPPGRYACLAVSDNGAGMDDETRARIFEPFFTTKPRGQGTGLGLSVVHGIAQAHSASMVVESTPGAGSVFRIYFAAVDAPVAADAPAPAAAPAREQGKHVLYIDDEDAIIFLMQRLLERRGYRVSGYTDPRKAVAAARADPARFDLAVTDYSMPGMSGLDVAHALREIRGDLPVVMASGYITEELRQKAPAAGVRELIYKPNTVEDLCEAVARCASARELGAG